MIARRAATVPGGGARLAIMARDARAVQRRFGIWPPSLDPQDLALLLQAPLPKGGYEENEIGQLVEAGLLKENDSVLVAAIPIYGKYNNQTIATKLKDSVSLLSRLQPFLDNLRTAWQSAIPSPQWGEIDHSLLVSFYLWGCGTYLLLDYLDTDCIAALLGQPEGFPGGWHRFISASPGLGLSLPVGDLYPHSGWVEQVISSSHVKASVADINENGEIIFYGSAGSVINRLDGFVDLGRARGGPDVYKVTWPMLSPAHLQSVWQPLQLAVRALAVVIREALNDCLASIDGEESIKDVALIAYSLLAEKAIRYWLEVGLLSPIATPMAGPISEAASSNTPLQF